MKRVVCGDCIASVQICERGLKLRKTAPARLLREYAISMLCKWEKSRLRSVPSNHRRRSPKNEDNDSKSVDSDMMDTVNDHLMRAISAMPECPDLLCRVAHFKHKYMNDLVSAQRYYYRATVVSPCSASSHSNFASFLART